MGEGFFTLLSGLDRVGEYELSKDNNESLEEGNLEGEQDEEIEEELQEFEEDPANVVFEKGKGFVASEDADRLSQQGFYGTRIDGNKLELEPVELLHLLERKRAIATTPSGNIISSDYIVNSLLEEDPDLWIRYLVFRDLRSRGYAVRKGFGSGIGFRVYARGDKPGDANAKELVYVLKEGVPISLSDLDLVTKTAAGSRKDLVFALVDQNGEVNFYKVAQATLRDRSGDEQ
ncbi:tRNA-intron lyase [Candidatus Thorarchaeota archaeon]|nr:tRNA-intron lyase [Candidatus Thorarchaeota archaeon]TFG98782.1 MAG: tRNA-intron lyase [Candidatus Thorarchaeota archaeon]